MISTERLKKIQIFSSLLPADLERLVPLFREAKYKLGDIVCKQGEPGDVFYVLEKGTLRIRRVDRQNREAVLGHLNAPAHFGETSLLTGVYRDASVDVFSGQADIFALAKSDFDALLNEHPQIKPALVIRPEVRQKLEQRADSWLSPGEIILAKTRRHWYALARSLVAPIVISLASALVGIVSQFFVPNAASPAQAPNLLNYLSIGSFLIALAVMVLGVLWYTLDWRNDFYIVTNQRIIHIEKVIFFFEEREVAPIERVTNVAEIAQGVAARVFGFNHLSVQTASREADIDFTYAPQSAHIRQAIFGQLTRLTERAAFDKREQRLAKIRGDLWRHLAPAQETAVPATGEATPLPSPATAARSKRRVTRTVKSGWANRLFGLKIEHGDAITWRKHWFVLFGKLAKPFSFMLIDVALGISLHFLLPRLNSLTYQVAILAVYVLSLGMIAFYFWYVFEDWSNDVYRVTSDRLVDGERSPFRLRERYVETTLDRVQNASFKKEGIAQTLLDYGTVTIETAGQEQFIFLKIHNPYEATQEILRRRDVHRLRANEEREREDRTEYLDWFREYHRFLQERGEVGTYEPPVNPPSPQQPSEEN